MKLTKIIKTSTEGHISNHKWKYELLLPRELAKWDVWDYWEKERLESMQKLLTKKDIIFDVGTENGWISALIAKYMVGGKNMVLFEPDPVSWATVKNIWELNSLETPLMTVEALIGDVVDDGERFAKYAGWVESAFLDNIDKKSEYRYIHNKRDGENTGVITLDDFSGRTGIIPTAINIDIEGAELLALKGSAEIMRKYKPLIWVSIHPDLMERDYGNTKESLISFMKKQKYKCELLGVDHEHHYLFTHI